jgi:hypothetical protein
MSPSDITAAAVIVALAACAITALAVLRACERGHQTTKARRELDRVTNQLNTYRTTFGEPEPFLLFVQELVDPEVPQPGKDELR